MISMPGRSIHRFGLQTSHDVIEMPPNSVTFQWPTWGQYISILPWAADHSIQSVLSLLQLSGPACNHHSKPFFSCSMRSTACSRRSFFVIFPFDVRGHSFPEIKKERSSSGRLLLFWSRREIMYDSDLSRIQHCQTREHPIKVTRTFHYVLPCILLLSLNLPQLPHGSIW